MNKKLTRDMENMEMVLCETANTREWKYTYAFALVIYHILEWIYRRDK